MALLPLVRPPRAQGRELRARAGRLIEDRASMPYAVAGEFRLLPDATRTLALRTPADVEAIERGG
jgi:hypothetical protein